MRELPAVVAEGCLCLEYLLSTAAVTRGWRDNVIDVDGLNDVYICFGKVRTSQVRVAVGHII